MIENPYGLEALWKQGDFVSKGTLIILVIMSMGSWYIMFVKVYEQWKLFRQARDVQAKFWQAGSVQEGMSSLKEGSPFRFIAESGVKATTHHEGKLLEQIDLNTWVTMSIQRAVDNVLLAHAGRPGVPRHRRLHRAVRRPVRHGVGHLPRAHRHRHRRARPRSTRSPARWARR